ncbi:winged helix-turn-helix domain-containing protein [Frankia sp. CNm7]|uniref:Winged helix-turn-helix domain-containing protein n=1 Tax=Frankia nepalensis TaxID=1836974 RepID=A0A937UQY3_9ACTN|nr:BTAD domain-containing putative transcriptional regulator [Frankia nepalensis]MBL7502070.1 winged helix-turn-helix domain-containing protein [Frankia nepalensis]MBL7511804.1 winged helix-turn-helix domain-containing protein [Frankia nepalensis]MBL7524657.1 winged helix-turn-helix domain-containing protein [Frankia nepalensis]MBL7630568.1 winged helix-turn-helix domain-containing protein [Frankia nepalensis]
MQVLFGVLGPVVAWDDAGDAIALKGPRHRAVLARLIIARRRVVPVSRLVEDLWTNPPPEAVGAVRTFVAALRRALEPGRPPRAPARLLVTEGPGYALRAEQHAVDAWRFEQEVAAAATLPPTDGFPRLARALECWRGPAYAEFADQPWARAERSRLADLRLHAVERQAEARLALGLAAEAAADLDAHVAEHPWREDAWRLLALALYRAGRQADALAVLRRARALLAEQLGVDPGPGLRGLEADILRHAAHLDPQPGGATGRVWAQTAAAYDRAVPSGARARLESTVGLLRDLAVTGGGGLQAARRHRVAAIAAADELGDAELTARLIGAYDVPAIWTRVDEPEQAAQVIAAAERALSALPPGGHEAARARLLATIALESRGTRAARGPEAARQAEEIARRLDDPRALAFALNAVFMQTFHRAGLAPRRDEIGAELVALSARHGLATFEVLGHLIRLQARGALGDFLTADQHASAADRLAERHELPLVGVFTQWYAALRLAATRPPATAEIAAAYRDAAARLEGAGMPGLEHGLLPLALLCTRVEHALPASADALTDWGPYEPWARPHTLLAEGRREEAAAALRKVPDPPRDLLFEALWCLTAQAAISVGDRETMERAQRELTPAAAELAGAGSGLLTVGPVSRHLGDLAAALRRLGPPRSGR